MKTRTTPLLLSLLLLTGCSTFQGWWGDLVGTATNDAPAIIGVATNVADLFKTNPLPSRAVVVGLTAVDASAYDGWPGDCSGTDVDADTFILMCREKRVAPVLLMNKQATKQAFMNTCVAACNGLTSNGVFVLFFSGHGSQLPDVNGDEADGLDETLCLWDGELVDDELCAFWQTIPADVRVFFVTDSCNSGSNFKFKPIKARSFIPRDYTGQLIHYGGCADGQSSFGSESGGAWTTALVDGWNVTNTYKGWYKAAADRMPLTQRPVYAEYGHVTDAFRNTRILE